MSDSICLDLIVHQTQGIVDLAHVWNPRRLNLARCQVQGSVGLTRVPDPRHLDLIVNQVQDNNHPPLTCPGEWPISLGSNLRKKTQSL